MNLWYKFIKMCKYLVEKIKKQQKKKLVFNPHQEHDFMDQFPDMSLN